VVLVRFLERILAAVLQFLRLDTVKRRILALAVLATLIPTGTTGWLLYSQNKTALTGKIHEELRSASVNIAREFDLWLKERVYELRVFSGSYELSENVEKALRGGGARAQVLRRAQDYLKSVQNKFSDYEDLFVVDTTGAVIVAVAKHTPRVTLPPDWQKQARLDQPILAGAHWDDDRGKTVMTVAVPLKTANGRFLGVLAATINFGSMEAVLRQWAQGQTRHLYIVKADGTRVLSSLLEPKPVLTTRLPEEATRLFFAGEAGELQRMTYEELEVLAVMQQVPRLGWGVVAEKNYEDAYRALLDIRNVALASTAWLLLGVGLIAYLLSLTISGPLTRLTEGAARVAGGDLSVEIATDPPREIGRLATMFNTMVTYLREAQQELTSVNLALNERNQSLEAISATDALTGLHNRRRMLDALNAEVARHGRHGRSFSIVMVDVDHFKKYNDTYGHPAGDALLKTIGGILKSSLRTNDFAARYGGEEFLILLPDQDQKGAVEVAERIRQRIEAETEDRANKRKAVTASLGVATFPESGRTADPLLANADAALYRAKNSGRNRVLTAGS
jgi:diguanylate cyclase (GGDEF)-like protein